MDPYSPPLYAADRFALVSWLAFLSLLVGLIISRAFSYNLHRTVSNLDPTCQINFTYVIAAFNIQSEMNVK